MAPLAAPERAAVSAGPAAEPARRKGRAAATARDVPPAIQWHEGMLLLPQHFQLSAQRHEALLQYHAAAISPFHWGVRHCRIDPVSLVDGRLRVLELEAVMPDGLVVSHLPDEAPDLALDLAPYVEEMKQRPLAVHLAVAARGRGLALGERFAFEESGPAADENTGEGELAVPVLRPRLRLLLGDDPPPKYVSFPLARIAYRNEVFTRARFEPPWLRVAPGSPLYELCLAVAARLRAKAAFLADQVRSPSTSARVPQLLETKALLHGLVGELPPFEALLRSGAAHPFPLYLALCALVGHAAALGRSLVPPVLDPYDHNDLLASFEQARAAVWKAIDEGIQEAYTAYSFDYQDGAFALLFDPDWTTRTLILGVRAPTGVSDADMAAWVAASLIAARSKIPSLRDRRVAGTVRKRIEAGADLVPSRGVTLYSLSADPEFVTPGEELEIRNLDDPGDRRPEEIVLYVRNRP
jgi:type VI secretion system protein ImpJ